MLRRHQWLSAVLAALVVAQQPLLVAQEGLIPRLRSKLVGMKKSTEFNNVEKLAMCIDELEEELLEDGTVVAKAPDVWGEARLTAHRAEFETELHKQVEKFEVRLNGTLARSDQAFLASALALSSSLAPAGKSTAPAINSTQVNNLLPSLAVSSEADPNVKPTSMNMFITQPGKLTELSDFAGFDDSKVKLDQTIELDQMARFLNHLHEIRRMNEGDDTADSPGYSLNLVRIPVSIMPGSKTRKGHAAEITVTAEAHVTEELLPTTFRALVINDLVDQLTVPVHGRVRNVKDKRIAIDAAYHATRTVLLEIAKDKKTHDSFRTILSDLEWFTQDGFETMLSELYAEPGPAQIALELEQISKAVESDNQDEIQRLVLAAYPLLAKAFSKGFSDKALEIDGVIHRYAVNMLVKNVGVSTNLAQSIALNQVTEQEIVASGDESKKLIDLFSIGLDGERLTLEEISQRVNEEASVQVYKEFDIQQIVMPFAQSAYTKSLIREYADVNAAFAVSASASGHRRARSPFSGSNLRELLGPDLDAITQIVEQYVDVDEQSLASSIRNLLRDELETAYESTFDPSIYADLCALDLNYLERSIVSGANLESLRGQVHRALENHNIRRDSMRFRLAWPILVESLLLSRQLNADIRHVSQDPDCGCMTPQWDLQFYGLDPQDDARQAFIQYVRCRWPIHVFALDPMTQDQNIADQYAMRREMQLAMALAVASGQSNAQSATRYARRLEMDLETVALNRTAVAFGHGKDTFGWRFMPRVQTPEFESNATVAMRDLLIGGPNRDDLKNKWELEPGMRECVAVVLMPSFITHVRFDCRGHFLPLACDRLGIKTPSDARTSVYDTVEMSRMIREMQNCAMCAMNESHLYRDGEVDRLMRRVEQLSDRLPLQTTHSRVPNENTLGGFEMFSSGVTDLAPELYDWYGEPGYKPGEEATIFLIGSNFSVTGTRVIVGNRSVTPTLLSREVMQVQIPKDAQSTESGVIDIHVATPYGVSQHVHVNVVQPQSKGPEKDNVPKAAPRLSWLNDVQKVIYLWNPTDTSGVKSWDVPADGILLQRPHEIVVRVPDEMTKNSAIPQDVALNVAISLELPGGKSYLVAANANAGMKYAPDRKGYVLEGASFIALHNELKSRLVGKLKALSTSASPPPGTTTLKLTGFVTPTGSVNPRVEIADQMTIELKFSPDTTPAASKK